MRTSRIAFHFRDVGTPKMLMSSNSSVLCMDLFGIYGILFSIAPGGGGVK